MLSITSRTICGGSAPPSHGRSTESVSASESGNLPAVTAANGAATRSAAVAVTKNVLFFIGYLMNPAAEPRPWLYICSICLSLSVMPYSFL